MARLLMTDDVLDAIKNILGINDGSQKTIALDISLIPGKEVGIKHAIVKVKD